jgi:small subunit ribosomal protein S9
MEKVIHTSGKRKRAVARATLKAGQGKIRINKKLLDTYSSSIFRTRIQEPLILAGTQGQAVNINVTVLGGGTSGQAEAARLAIGRALVQHDKKLKKVFEDYDRQLLVADIRRKETNKPNISKARAKRQKSYR